ncbi:MAG TPA: ATP-binding protein [Candidatus Thermoplasmatota archaeon]|nr:ATP-binding protein [Candidatus Thermoplasmatota archaeon]
MPLARDGPAPRGAAEEGSDARLLRSLAGLLDEGVLVLDAEGRIAWMNGPAADLHALGGRTPRTLAEYEARYSFRDVATLMAEPSPLARVLRGEAVPATEYRVLARGAGSGWRWRVRATPLVDDGGAPAGGIVLFQDVADARRNDEERRTLYVRERLARAAAERERDFIQRIFEAAPMPIAVFEGTEHRLAFLNHAASDLMGLAAMGGRSHAEILPREDPHLRAMLAAVYAGDEPHARAEMEYELPKGVLTLQSHYVPLPGPEARPIGVVWLALDVTGRRRAERALESARRQLSKSERLSALGALVSGVAHELRTPLAYIMNNVALVQRRVARGAPALADDVGPLLDEALAGADRISRIVGELRKFGETRPLAVTSSLDEIVRPAVDLFRATHVGPTEVRADLRRTLPVRADAYQMQQVALNLLQNAAEAMPEGGVVRVRTEDGNGVVRLVVEDNGPGIPEEVRGLVFDEFFTTKKGGTGLGLSIVRRIVRAHQGRVAYETGRAGTTFVVELPVAGDEE